VSPLGLAKGLFRSSGAPAIRHGGSEGGAGINGAALKRWLQAFGHLISSPPASGEANVARLALLGGRLAKQQRRSAVVFVRSNVRRSENIGLARRSLACRLTAPEVWIMPRTWP